MSLTSGQEFTRGSRQIRACYAEALETIAVPAGSFDTVCFRCGSVTSRLPVRSEMEVHSVYRSNRYTPDSPSSRESSR